LASIASASYRRRPLGFITRGLDDPHQAVTISTRSACRQAADGGEATEVVALTREQRIRLEVRDHTLDEVLESSVSHFRVLSLRSGRMLPHPKYAWIA
jgi:hypothetical protein